MVEIFPEIETFFQQEQFSQEQLDALKELMESKYKDDHSRKLAASAINIKLLQYQLSGPIVARINEKIKRTRTKLSSKKAATSSSLGKKLSRTARKKERIKKKYQDMIQRNTIDVVQVFYDNTINKPLKKAAIYLRISSEQFIRDLKLKERININENTKFNEDIWEANKQWIAPRLVSNHKEAEESNKNNNVKRSNNNRKSTPGVYGKLVKAKTIGSLIYTRMS